MDETVAVGVVAVAVTTFLVLAVGMALVVRDTVRGSGRWGVNLKRVVCPECGEPAPAVRRPKNRRQMLWGGCTCAVCGTEYDKWGRPVGTRTDSSAPPADSW